MVPDLSETHSEPPWINEILRLEAHVATPDWGYRTVRFGKLGSDHVRPLTDVTEICKLQLQEVVRGRGVIKGELGVSSDSPIVMVVAFGPSSAQMAKISRPEGGAQERKLIQYITSLRAAFLTDQPW